MTQQGTPFQIRGWGIRVVNDFDRFEEAVQRAVAEASAYGVTMLDLHDGAVPPGIGWVDLFARYRQANFLRTHTSFTYHGHEMTEEQREEYRERFCRLCREVKRRGLQIHVWHHAMRDLPEEWLAAEPTLSRLEGRRLWQVLGGMLDDFLEAVPEVDAITLTARQFATLGARDALASGERLRAMYQCAYESCRRARRQLVVREVTASHAEKEAFLYAVTPLPPDVILMVKDVWGDWYHLDAPLNPMLYRLSGRRILVETDLFGEHWGRLEVPLCRLRQIHRSVGAWVHLSVIGAVGRIMVREHADASMVHIFDTPGAANVRTFCRLLQEPGEEPPEEDPDHDAFDMRLWLDWLRERYGEVASPYVVAALDRTPRICQLTFYLGGAYFQHRSYLPDPGTFERRMWPTFVKQTERLGLDMLRWEKEEALRLVRQSLRDIELAEPSLDREDHEALLQGLERMRDVIFAYRALVGLCIGRLQPSRMPAAAREAVELARHLETTRGPSFFGGLPERLRTLARYLRDVTSGVPVEEAVAQEREEHDEETMDFSDLGIPQE